MKYAGTLGVMIPIVSCASATQTRSAPAKWTQSTWSLNPSKAAVAWDCTFKQFRRMGGMPQHGKMLTLRCTFRCVTMFGCIFTSCDVPYVPWSDSQPPRALPRLSFCCSLLLSSAGLQQYDTGICCTCKAGMAQLEHQCLILDAAGLCGQCQSI